MTESTADRATGEPSPVQELSAPPPALARKLDTLFRAFAGRSDVSEPQFVVRRPKAGWEWRSPNSGRAYFIASVTKLYTAALVFQLCDEGRVSLETTVASVLGDEARGIHVMRGVDRSGEITVRQLLSHTSGIANYFEDPRRVGGPLIAEALRGDTALNGDTAVSGTGLSGTGLSGTGWNAAEALRITRDELAPHFVPGTRGKAFYSDTNFTLLGRIVEVLEGAPFADVLERRVLAPLGLTSTWMFTPATLDHYHDISPLLFKRMLVRSPHALASVGAQGGLVSTLDDQLAFLEAVLDARVFSRELLTQAQAEWRRIFFPLQYGIGMMRYALPRAMTPFGGVPPLIGHAGSTGSLLFAAPDDDLVIAGTANQAGARSLPYRWVVRAASTALA